MNFRILVLSFLIVECHSAQVPSYFKRCYRRQKDFDECYNAAAQSAAQYLNAPIKELGLVSLDPMEIPSLSIAAGTGAAAFTQTYKNFKMYGLSKTNCTYSKIDFEKKVLVSRCLTPEFEAVFEYEFIGRILIIPIHGKGGGTTRLSKSDVCRIDRGVGIKNADEYEKNGHQHLRVVNSTFDYRPERMIFRLENLFGKDEALNENLNQVFDENWEALYEDVGPSYGYAIAQVLASIFNRMMEKVSISDLFGEE